MSWDTLTERPVQGRRMNRRLVPALLLALAVAGCPIPQPPPPATTVAGVYTVRLPAADASARVVTLWLEPGGAATLETVYVGKPRTPAETGVWAASGDEVTVRLDGQSQPLVFTIAGDRLVPKQWDRTQYGDTGLPLSRRASYQHEGPTLRDTFSSGATKPAP
jgi:NlpE N-terminal domain